MGQAQQRPRQASDGVSEQAQASNPTAQPRQPRRVDWMQIGTVVAGLAAAGGLIFSGWTGYYSVRVSRDQLDQSREETDRELRRQAMLVSTWTQKGEKEQTTGFIVNRSLDPIHQVAIGIVTGADVEIDEDPLGQRGPKTLMYMGSLPPCSRVTIPAIAVKRALVGMPLDVNYGISGVSFVDVYGRRWARRSAGPLQPLETVLSEEHYSPIGKVLLGDKYASTRSERPGDSNSGLEAPEPLKDCGTDK